MPAAHARARRGRVGAWAALLALAVLGAVAWRVTSRSPAPPEGADGSDRSAAESPSASASGRGAPGAADGAAAEVRPPLRRLEVRPGVAPAPGELVFATLVAALGEARPGDLVDVAPGVYEGPIETVRPGGPRDPIRLRGGGARLEGGGTDDAVTITHDYVHLEGFEITGADRLVLVRGASGVVLADNHLHGAGGECVRLRWFARRNLIRDNRIEDCGDEGFDLAAKHKNGEGVYIGTAPEQLSKNPTSAPDNSDGNVVRGNRIRARAECVDVKEAARDNLIEGNDCRGGLDEEAGGFSSRGVATVIRDNLSAGHKGAGVRLGGDGRRDGIDSVVVGNRLVDNDGFGVKVERRPQREICGNVVQGNDDGAVNEKEDFDPAARC
ncbi:MAG: nitrous oxide reductase family maturation protein NosD [Acidimicrobiales bacterium]